MALVCVADFEEAAFKKIPKNALDYYKSGAGNELTLGLNRSSFDRIRIRPRLMRNVSKRDLSCNVLGLKLSMPIGRIKSYTHFKYEKLLFHKTNRYRTYGYATNGTS